MSKAAPSSLLLKALALVLFAFPARAALVTGRLSMGILDPLQCGFSYSGFEQVQGYPIVALDGATFGSIIDGVHPWTCGKKVKIAGVIHIVADRIWQNDGAGGNTYNDRDNANQKKWADGTGFQQYDTAIYTYWQRGGNGNFDVIWM